MPVPLPTTADVGALLRARTKDVNGNELGTFNSDTRPTDEEVDLIIGNASSDVYAELGEVDALENESLQTAVSRLIALRAAMLIELSYFPEQVQNDRSPFEHLRDMYNEALPRMTRAVAESEDDGVHEAGDGLKPRYDFPTDSGGMIGNDSRW